MGEALSNRAHEVAVGGEIAALGAADFIEAAREVARVRHQEHRGRAVAFARRAVALDAMFLVDGFAA